METSARPAPGGRTALVLLLAINLFNYIDRYVLAAVEPEIRSHFFRPDDPNAHALVGFLGTAFLVSYMVSAPIFGWLADRTSRWIIIGLSVILWSAATAASGLAGTFALLLMTRLFVGVGELERLPWPCAHAVLRLKHAGDDCAHVRNRRNVLLGPGIP